MIQITDTVKHLIIINVLFFAATYVFKDQVYDLLAMHYPANPLFKPWQILTHMFMHGNVSHILFNMIGLWMFGSTVEQMIGRKNFLILYFIAGIGAVLFSVGIDYFQYNKAYEALIQSGIQESEFMKYVLNGSGTNNDYANILVRKYNTSLVGASGALYGIMVAFGVLLPKAKMGLMFLPIMIESRIFIPLILLYDISFGVFRVGDNIGHFAHVGGAIFGFIAIWYMKQKYIGRRK